MKTTNIPKMQYYRAWSAATVDEACKKAQLYSRGTNEEYRRMLSNVMVSDPNSSAHLYNIADDICGHSEDLDIEVVLYILLNNACTHIMTIVED